MHLKSELSQRIGIKDIQEIVSFVKDNNKRKQDLYHLLYDEDETVAYQAAWVFFHFDKTELQWLYPKQNELIDEVLVCQHGGKRRLLLNLILRQPVPESPRMDFLDFCMERMISKDELPGVQSLCMKMAYEICRPFPELIQELKQMLEIMEPDLLLPSMRAVRKNTLKAIEKEVLHRKTKTISKK